MNIIGERLIEVLLADSTLITLLSDADSVFAQFSPVRKAKYVTVPTNTGEDQNNIPADTGEVEIQAVVSRKVENAGMICVNIAKRIDTIINKGEIVLTNSNYKIISMVRSDGTGLQIDDAAQEYWFGLTYAYIIDEST